MRITEVSKENVEYGSIYTLTKEDNMALSFHGIRVLDQKHVKEIEKDIMDGNAKYMSPIEVNINSFGVIEGNHRYQAALNAWEKGSDYTLRVIFYDLSEEEEADIVVKKNTSQKSWTVKDFKHKLLVEGNPDARRLQDFCLSHPMLHGKQKKDGTIPIKDRYAMAFLKGANITKEIISGTISITQDDIETAEELYKEVETIYKLLGFVSVGGWFECFIQGWYEFRTNNKYCKRLDKFGIERYYEALVAEFDREKITSKQQYLERFVAVLIQLEKSRLAA